MPHDFDPQTRQYRFNGRPVTRREVRDEVTKLITFVEKEAKPIADRYARGVINLSQFEIEMRELLKAGHIVSASVGRGGRARMQQKDWGRVGAKIRWQYDYLAKFTRKLSSGKLTKAYSENRAKSYASALYISFTDARMEAQTEVIDGGSDERREIQCRLIQNSEEGCVECESDAAEGWMSVDDMGEIGSRLCGDFCKCEIEFSDET
jgi:hypothetical protein